MNLTTLLATTSEGWLLLLPKIPVFGSDNHGLSSQHRISQNSKYLRAILADKGLGISASFYTDAGDGKVSPLFPGLGLLTATRPGPQEESNVGHVQTS